MGGKNASLVDKTGRLACEAARLRNQARSLLAAGQRRAAIGALFLACEASPGDAETIGALGEALVLDGAVEAAAPHCEMAFRLEPSAAHASTWSCVLLEQGRLEEALRVTDLVEPGPALLINRSIALEGLGRLEAAVATAREVVAAVPGNAFAAHHLATMLLAQGRLTAEAWALYEARLALPGVRPMPSGPRWRGESIAGATILLQAEQGFGDTMQFVRYAPLVAALGARVVLAVQPGLVRLLRETPGVECVIATGATLPRYDVMSPLLSLPGLFGTTLGSIPPAVPYAGFGPVRPAAARVRVGVVWSGSSGFVADRERSVPEGMMQAWAGMPGIELCGLQMGRAGPGMVDMMAGVRDFADTAARVAALDLVVSVDTAVAHLAATMGKPVWLLSRFRGCWRWLQGRADTPWYPTMRIIRQDRPGDWSGAMEAVREGLAKLGHARGDDRGDDLGHEQALQSSRFVSMVKERGAFEELAQVQDVA